MHPAPLWKLRVSHRAVCEIIHFCQRLQSLAKTEAEATVLKNLVHTTGAMIKARHRIDDPKEVMA